MSLELEAVTVVFRGNGRRPVPAVVEVTLQVERGQVVGLVGESGSGKSSLGKAAVGLLRPTSGCVRFNGKPVSAIGRRARPSSQLGLQMVLQNPFESLNPRRTVGNQIKDAMRASHLSKRLQDARLSQLLGVLGLAPDTAGKFPHQFSGGQRQRVAVARALAASPSMLILDEPFASLDASAQAQLANVLRVLADEEQVGMLVISHDLAIVRHIADRIAVMYLGTIVESGVASDVWSSALHPYTEALIGAIPKVDGRGALPIALPGEIADPANPPSGCRFHPRCPHAFAVCQVDSPVLIEASPGRNVACWLRHPDEAVRASGADGEADSDASSDEMLGRDSV